MLISFSQTNLFYRLIELYYDICYLYFVIVMCLMYRSNSY